MYSQGTQTLAYANTTKSAQKLLANTRALLRMQGTENSDKIIDLFCRILTLIGLFCKRNLWINRFRWECRALNLEKTGREEMKEEWEGWEEWYSGRASGLNPGIRWQPNQPRLWWCRTCSLLTAHDVLCVHTQHISKHTYTNWHICVFTFIHVYLHICVLPHCIHMYLPNHPHL